MIDILNLFLIDFFKIVIFLFDDLFRTLNVILVVLDLVEEWAHDLLLFLRRKNEVIEVGDFFSDLSIFDGTFTTNISIFVIDDSQKLGHFHFVKLAAIHIHFRILLYLGDRGERSLALSLALLGHRVLVAWFIFSMMN